MLRERMKKMRKTLILFTIYRLFVQRFNLNYLYVNCWENNLLKNQQSTVYVALKTLFMVTHAFIQTAFMLIKFIKKQVSMEEHYEMVYTTGGNAGIII